MNTQYVIDIFNIYRNSLECVVMLICFQGRTLFVESLVQEIERVEASEHHYLVSVQVPTTYIDRPGIYRELWQPKNIQPNSVTLPNTRTNNPNAPYIEWQ